MGSTLEMIIVGMAVAVAIVWAAVSGWRAVKSKGVCSSCGSSDDCPIAGNPDALAELSQKDQLPHLDSCQSGGRSCHELTGTLEKSPSTERRESRSEPFPGPSE